MVDRQLPDLRVPWESLQEYMEIHNWEIVPFLQQEENGLA